MNINTDIFKIQSNNVMPSRGKILISEPFLHDVTFGRSVVLLVDHTEEGSMGLIINKPLPLMLNDIIKEFKYIEDKTTSYRILSESASHSKSKERVTSFIANTRDILLYFNNQYEIGIPESVICKKYYGTLIRNMASFGRKDFILSYFDGVKYYPSLLLNCKLLLLFFIRIILGKKC